VALMMKHGEIEKADVMIFADTGAEPPSVYRWLGQLASAMAGCVPLVKVQHHDGLTADIEAHACGKSTWCASPPLFTDGGGMIRRQCTRDFKVAPILRKCNELRGGRKGVPVVEVMGISWDERRRMREPDRLWLLPFSYPLIERQMTRQDCKRWMVAHGYSIPPRSACVYCPYRCNTEWERLRTFEPDAWAEACRMDELMRHGIKYAREACYVHRQLVPLREAKIEDDTANRFPGSEGWGVECEGMCGV
jgi:hypothetical protein